MTGSLEIHDARVRPLNDRGPRRGRYVLYWMQQSQREAGNHALEYAVQRANALGLPLRIGFGLTDDYPEAAERHYRFMLEGLRATARDCAARGIPLIARLGSPDQVALAMAAGAAELICDRGYLRHQKRWRQNVAAAARCPVTQVEADVVVPVAVASRKAEWGARTLRPRIDARREEFLVPLRRTPLAHRGGAAAARGLDLDDIDRLLGRLRLDRGVPSVSHVFRGGADQARARLRAFVARPLRRYRQARQRPEAAVVSHLAMYLHFGQISPIDVALAARGAKGAGRADVAAFLEELIVRRELAANFVENTEAYDAFRAVPAWARATLSAHASDPRRPCYTRAELERAATADPYWNAAMREMRYTGYLHNQMRMYWGKKILEWTPAPDEAHAVALALNNRYLLDGRDPASFANVGWIFGLHDRPWPERPIYGTVRSMTAAGLRRKSEIDAYVAGVNTAVAEARRCGVRYRDDPETGVGFVAERGAGGGR
jgi:deoxyribodipyrimidine photo-lyase